MKIRTQDAKRYLDYGEVNADYYGDCGQAAVYVINRFHSAPVCVGVYEDIGRAKGVLYEIDLAYQNRQRTFYAPAE